MKGTNHTRQKGNMKCEKYDVLLWESNVYEEYWIIFYFVFMLPSCSVSRLEMFCTTPGKARQGRVNQTRSWSRDSLLCVYYYLFWCGKLIIIFRCILCGYQFDSFEMCNKLEKTTEQMCISLQHFCIIICEPIIKLTSFILPFLSY